jgi:hypothetical protein
MKILREIRNVIRFVWAFSLLLIGSPLRAAPPASRPALHSLDPLPVPVRATGAAGLVLPRPAGAATQPAFRILGDAPNDSQGEMMKPRAATAPTTAPIAVVSVLKNGDVLFGENAGLRYRQEGNPPSLHSDPGHASPIDFWWDAPNRKLHVRSLEVTENGDAPEIGIRRSGDGTYPNGPPLPVTKGTNLGLLFWMGWAEPGGFDDRDGVIFMRAAEDFTDKGVGANMYFATTPIGSTAAPIARLIISSEGQVGVGINDPQAQLHVMGPQLGGFAEDYASDESLEGGDVVAIDAGAAAPTVRKATRPYDPMLVGVIATRPGVRISQDAGTDGKAQHAIAARQFPVAVAGRASIKISTENGAIHAGDSLTSSSTPGVAMKATQKGAAIGKALRDYSATGIGTILMLPNVSVYAP